MLFRHTGKSSYYLIHKAVKNQGGITQTGERPAKKAAKSGFVRGS
jgi:hypothetical protein